MNIAIIFGGKSVEHDVSIVTAKQIYSVAKIKYNVSLIYIDRNDNFLLYKNPNFDFEDFKGQYKFKQIYFQNGSINYANGLISKSIKIDCAIVCCHGGSGESGIVQSVLSMAKIPSSSGSIFALACAMDKWQTKNMLKAIHIDVIDGVCVEKGVERASNIKDIEGNLNYPVIVKPIAGGSNIGIELANNRKELEKALEVGFCFDDKCVVESALQNFEEYNQAVLGDEQMCELSHIEKPIRSNDILSYEDKYLSGGSKSKKGMKGQKRFAAKLSENLKRKIEKTSQTVFKQLGFFGVIRIDYII